MATIVTAYYNIPSKFTNDTYWNWISNFCSIPFNVVIFTSPDLVDRFSQLRVKHPNTKIVSLPFNQLYHYKYYDTYNVHYKADYYKKHSPELYIIWAEKVKFVMRAIEMNPFDNDIFIWCDIGVFRHAECMNTYMTFPNKDKIVKDKMNFLILQHFTQDDRKLRNNIMGQLYGTVRLGGGIHAGGIEAWIRYNKLWDETLSKYFNNHRFAGQDQCIIGTIYLEHPDLFHLIDVSKVPETPAMPDRWFYLLHYWN